VNLDRWWPGTSNNYWNIDDLVRAYNRVREESRIVLPGQRVLVEPEDLGLTGKFSKWWIS
jgi:hypothetical protein